jgi:hypothetical protein
MPHRYLKGSSKLQFLCASLVVGYLERLPAVVVAPPASDPPRLLLPPELSESPMVVEAESSAPPAVAPASLTPFTAELREALLQAALIHKLETLALRWEDLREALELASAR